MAEFFKRNFEKIFMEDQSIADQEFLASFGVDIDESGVSRLQKILTENKTLGDSLAASFNAAAEGVKAFKESISTNLPSLFGGYGNVTENLFGEYAGLKIGLNIGWCILSSGQMPDIDHRKGGEASCRRRQPNLNSLQQIIPGLRCRWMTIRWMKQFVSAWMRFGSREKDSAGEL